MVSIIRMENLLDIAALNEIFITVYNWVIVIVSVVTLACLFTHLAMTIHDSMIREYGPYGRRK